MAKKERKNNERFKCIVLPKRPLIEALKLKKKNKSKKYSLGYSKAAHKHCSCNKKEILESELCGCFNCLRLFHPKEILNWCDEDNPKGATAMCPFCYVDSVIGSKSGYPVNDPGFLEEMYKYWF